MSILNTKLTWNILEQDLGEALKTEAKFGSSGSAVRLGEASGFLSQIALVTFDWSENGGNLPEKAIVKISCCGEFTGDSIDLEQGLCDNELDAYLMENPASKLFDHFPKPVFYCGRKYLDNGYIAVEFIPDSEAVTKRYFDSVPDEIIYQGLDLIADLTIKSLKNPNLVEKWTSTAYKTVLQDHCQLKLIVNRLIEMKQTYPEILETVEYLLMKADELKESFEKNLRDPMTWAKKPILCHGDMWTPNILCSIKEEKIIAILDWQLVHIGTPARDLVFLLFSGLAAEEYEKRYTGFVRYFYEKIVDGTNCKTDELPWKTLDELMEEYEKMYSHLAFMMFSFFTEAKSALLKGREKDEAKFELQVTIMAREVARCLKKWF